MYQFEMNIDLKALEEQLYDFEAVTSYSRLAGTQKESMIGILNLLGVIRDAVEKANEIRDANYKSEPAPESRKMTDQLAIFICEGFEQPESDAELVRAWQWLIDTNMAWELQGSFGRIAKRMIEEGLCKKAPKKSSIIIPKFFSRN